MLLYPGYDGYVNVLQLGMMRGSELGGCPEPLATYIIEMQPSSGMQRRVVWYKRPKLWGERTSPIFSVEDWGSPSL